MKLICYLKNIDTVHQHQKHEQKEELRGALTLKMHLLLTQPSKGLIY